MAAAADGRSAPARPGLSGLFLRDSARSDSLCELFSACSGLTGPLIASMLHSLDTALIIDHVANTTFDIQLRVITSWSKVSVSLSLSLSLSVLAHAGCIALLSHSLLSLARFSHTHRFALRCARSALRGTSGSGVVSSPGLSSCELAKCVRTRQECAKTMFNIHSRLLPRASSCLRRTFFFSDRDGRRAH